MKTRSTKIKSWLRPIIWLSLAFLISQTAQGAPAPHEPNSSQQVVVHENGLTVQWSASELDWHTDDLGTMPQIDGFETDARPGFMQLPFKTVSFAIPADTEFATTVTSAKAIPQNTRKPVMIAPAPAGVVRDADNQVIGGDFKAVGLKATDQTTPVIVEEIGTMGGIRLGRATFYPITAQKNGALAFVQNATVDIVFTSTRAVPALHMPLLNSPLADAVSQEVANPSHMIPNRATMPHRQNMLEPTMATAVIDFAGEGMAQITGQQLLNAGINPAQFNPNQLQVLHGGAPLPLLWMGNNNDQFEPDEAVRFYAPRFTSRWSATAPFLLRNSDTARLDIGARPGLTIDPEARLTQQQRFEENLVYSSDCLCGELDLGHDGDRWMWQELRRADGRSQSQLIETTLARPDLNQPAMVSISMLGKTNLAGVPLDHHVAVELNGSPIGEIRWDGQKSHTQTLAIPAGLLQITNKIELTMVESGTPIDSVWLDAIRFDYTTNTEPPAKQEIFYGADRAGSYALPVHSSAAVTVFDVTNPQAPQILSNINRFEGSVSWGDEGTKGATYVLVPADDYLTPTSVTATSGLSTSATDGASYIIIAPQTFISSGELAPLIKLRSEQGWQVGVESAEEIYVAFGDGVARPEAIRDYLQWAYHTWDTPPQMVLLVGDGSTDPKQHLASSPVTRIPPFLATVDPWMGETAADNRFVTIDGDDNLPDLMLGRLPVNTITELNQVVTKILRYETAEPATLWNAQTLWAADNAGDSRLFEWFSEELIAYFIQRPFYGHSFYLSPQSDNQSAVQQNIVTRWRKGAGLMMYMGHASRHQWAAERLFHIDDVALLGNQERLPFVMHLSCLTGSFHSAHLTALDEQLVRQHDGGGIAVWGSSGLGVATGHHHLAAGALDSLYKQQTPTVGIATMAGKLRLATRGPEHMLMLDTFNLLGDPATQLNLNVIDTSQHSVHLPFVQR